MKIEYAYVQAKKYVYFYKSSLQGEGLNCKI